MPRILILHASVGTGHKRAAEALAQALRRRQPGEVRVEDVLDHTPSLFRIAYARSYLELSERAPVFWGLFHSQTNEDPAFSEVVNNIRKLVESSSTNDLKDLLREYRPEVIVCTHFLPLEMLVRMKRNGKLAPPVYCVVTDFVAHTFWIYSDIEGYFVSDEQTRRQLIDRGVMAENIVVTGIPIDPAFSEPRDRDAIRRELDLDHQRPVITLFGGGVDDDRVRAVVEGLLHNGCEATLVIVAGRNKTLQESLADLQSSPQMGLAVLGYIDYVDDLVAASDLVITKAGGLIVSEVLARGVPLVVIDPIPGQEEWNADFVVATGAGIQLRIVESVPNAVCQLLSRPDDLMAMRRNATAAGQPNAAFAVADYLLEDLKNHQ